MTTRPSVFQQRVDAFEDRLARLQRNLSPSHTKEVDELLTEFRRIRRDWETADTPPVLTPRSGEVTVQMTAFVAERARAQCGTYSGYARHLRESTPPCDACREANARWQRGYRRRTQGVR